MRLWKRIRRFLEPPRKLRPTRVGWFFLAGVIALGVAAVNTGNNLLYFVLGMMLAAIVVSGILSERNLRSLVIRREAVGQAVAGDPVTLAFSLSRTRGWLPAVAITLCDHDPETYVNGMTVRFARVDRGRERRKLYTRVFPERGVVKLLEVEVGTSYPFALFRKSRRLDSVSEVRVRPKPAEVDLADASGGREEGVSSVLTRGEGLDLFGLRDQRSGDDARKIHWKASARARKVLVKDMAREEPPQVMVRLVLDGWPSAPAFERGVSRAAGLAIALSAEGYSVGLLAGERLVRPLAPESGCEAILDALVDVARTSNRVAEAELPQELPVVTVDAHGDGVAEATTVTGAPGKKDAA